MDHREPAKRFQWGRSRFSAPVPLDGEIPNAYAREGACLRLPRKDPWVRTAENAGPQLGSHAPVAPGEGEREIGREQGGRELLRSLKRPACVSKSVSA